LSAHLIQAIPPPAGLTLNLPNIHNASLEFNAWHVADSHRGIKSLPECLADEAILTADVEMVSVKILFA
jgi:hypothetical protein